MRTGQAVCSLSAVLSLGFCSILFSLPSSILISYPMALLFVHTSDLHASSFPWPHASHMASTVDCHITAMFPHSHSSESVWPPFPFPANHLDLRCNCRLSCPWVSGLTFSPVCFGSEVGLVQSRRSRNPKCGYLDSLGLWMWRSWMRRGGEGR